MEGRYGVIRPDKKHQESEDTTDSGCRLHIILIGFGVLAFFPS